MKVPLACVLTVAFLPLAAAQGLTLYGVVDADIGYTKTDGSPSDLSVDSGTSANSLIGLRGVEALGGDLKAKFQLESGFDADTGTLVQASRFYDRPVWLGLEGRFGELRLGRQDTFTYDWFGSVSPFQTGYKLASIETIFGYGAVADRIDNSVFYLAPAFRGLEVGVGYSFHDDGPEAANANNEVLSLGLRFTRGPLLAVLTYEKKHDAGEDRAPGRGDVQNLSLGGSYDFGGFTLHAGYGRLKNRDFDITAATEKSWLIGATVPLGEGDLLAAYQRAAQRNANEFGIDARRDGIALAYDYPVSARTGLYVYGNRYRNVDARADDPSRLADSSELGFGIRHVF